MFFDGELYWMLVLQMILKERTNFYWLQPFFVWLDVFPYVFDGLIIDYPILQWFCMAYSATKCFFTCFP